jgi:uncharacterized protein YciI
MSGPFADDSGALLIYDAPNLEEAQRLVAKDPYVVAGVVQEVALREWTIVVPSPATAG